MSSSCTCSRRGGRGSMGNEERGKGDKKKVRRKGPDTRAMGGWELYGWEL